MMMGNSNEIQELYQELLNAWNNRNAQAFSELFTQDGESIGFDGSQSIGKEEIYFHINPIFEHHPTAKYVSKVKSISFLHADTALLRAISGMIPPGLTDINSKVNAHHTLVAIKTDGYWRIKLFQNTPAQFHGRPELVEQMTEELTQLLD